MFLLGALWVSGKDKVILNLFPQTIPTTADMLLGAVDMI